MGRVFQSQQGERMLDYEQGTDPTAEADFEGVTINSMLVNPVSTMDENLCVMQFVNKSDGSAFTEDEANVCEMLALLAFASKLEREECEYSLRRR